MLFYEKSCCSINAVIQHQNMPGYEKFSFGVAFNFALTWHLKEQCKA